VVGNLKLDVREVGYEDVNAVMGVFFTNCYVCKLLTDDCLP
jgi:hypothetical protein